MRSPPRKNPATEGFTFLAEGGFARAYRKGDVVELLISPRHVFADDQESDLSYDAGKEVLIRARQLAPPEAKPFLPEIERVRIDVRFAPISRTDRTLAVYEFVYQMPRYYAVKSGTPAAKTAAAIRKFLDKQHIDANKIDTDLAGWEKIEPAAQTALLAIADAAAAVKGFVAWDDTRGNFSQTRDGQLVLRDLVHAARFSKRLHQLWLQEGG